MNRLTLTCLLLSTLAISLTTAGPLGAQEQDPQSPPPPAATAPTAINSVAQAAAPTTQAGQPSNLLIVPAGTHLPLLLRNTVNTRTAKPGDSVYFQTTYPIAANNRMAIPMGSFVRGEILAAKRPGRISGRGVIRVSIREMTFTNGYAITLVATPSSVDPHSGAGVDAQGNIVGPSSSLRDTTAVLLSTAGGAYVGAVAGGVINDAPGKGSLIGGGAGGLAGLIAVFATRGPEDELLRGTVMDVVFDRPLILDAAYLPADAGPGIDPQPHYPVVSQDTRRRDDRNRHTGSSVFLPFLLLSLLR